MQAARVVRVLQSRGLIGMFLPGALRAFPCNPAAVTPHFNLPLTGIMMRERESTLLQYSNMRERRHVDTSTLTEPTHTAHKRGNTTSFPFNILY